MSKIIPIWDYPDKDEALRDVLDAADSKWRSIVETGSPAVPPSISLAKYGSACSICPCFTIYEYGIDEAVHCETCPLFKHKVCSNSPVQTRGYAFWRWFHYNTASEDGLEPDEIAANQAAEKAAAIEIWTFIRGLTPSDIVPLPGSVFFEGVPPSLRRSKADLMGLFYD